MPRKKYAQVSDLYSRGEERTSKSQDHGQERPHDRLMLRQLLQGIAGRNFERARVLGAGGFMRAIAGVAHIARMSHYPADAQGHRKDECPYSQGESEGPCHREEL